MTIHITRCQNWQQKNLSNDIPVLTDLYLLICEYYYIISGTWRVEMLEHAYNNLGILDIFLLEL